MTYFLAFLVGTLVGGLVVGELLSVGFGMMYKRGEMFLKIKNRWYPYDPKA